MVELSRSWRANHSVEERKAFLAAVINSIPTPVLVKDDQHTYLAVNDAFTAFFHRDAKEIIGRNDYDFFSSEDAKFYQDTDRDALGKGCVIEYEHAYAINESIQWMLVRKSPLIAPDGERFVVLVLVNVTERREAERALRQSEMRFRRLTNLSADWYWEQDEYLRFTFHSLEVEANSGHPGHTSLGLTRWDHPGIDPNGADWAAHQATCRAHRPFRDFIYRRLGQDGRARWLSVSGEPVFDANGTFLGYQGVGRDVTEDKRAAQELERSKDLYAALSQTNRAIIHIREPQALFAEVCRVAVQFGHFRLVWIGFLDADTGWVRCAAIDGPASHGYPPLRVSVNPEVPEGGGYSSAVLRENQPYIVNDYFADPRIAPWAEVARATGVKSMAALPLRKDGRCIGVLSLYGDEVGFFTDELVGLLNEMADNLSFALTNLEHESQRDSAQRALKESEQRFRHLAANIPQVFWVAEPGYGRILYVSPAYEKVWGRSIETLLARADDWRQAIHPGDRARVEEALLAPEPHGFDHEYRILQADGSVHWIHDRAFPIVGDNGDVILMTGIAEDITVRRKAEDQLLFLAHHDKLTGLPNRVLFYDRLQQSLAQARRHKSSVAVIFLDLDHFKLVNDTAGHAAGDRLLQQVSHRFREAVRSGDTVGRLGGDEFALILSELNNSKEADAAAQKLMRVLDEPFEVDGNEVFVTASAGISLFPVDGEDPDTLIKHADTAMYRAKEAGRTNHQFYKPEMNARATERMSLESMLRRALDRDEFVLHYQPKVSFASGEITGVEALLRWNHPELGMVAPGRFVPILEDNGLIVQVGSWVLSEVCRQLKDWNALGLSPSVAVNLSGRQLQHKEFERSINRIFVDAVVDPRHIELEITESVLMRNPEHAAHVLESLKTLGLRLSVDDFGTGYSSLSYLKRFPLDALKIDRSFVQDLVTGSGDAAIVQAIIALAQTLKLKTVAEGIENQAQFALLSALQCDEYQGYYFSRPGCAADISKLLLVQRLNRAA
jgi:diguanylate cyclase (GGDEF)-like protein/PAS domain S-box-containing protein